jgi:hypothetical protein
MLDAADELFAVWDGKPARGYGGTADVMAVGREGGIPVTVVCPEGSQRDRPHLPVGAGGAIKDSDPPPSRTFTVSTN